MSKQMLVCTALLFAIVSPITAQQSPPLNAQKAPPTSAQATQIEAMVDKAAALVNSKGKAAFAEFRKSGSEWMSGNTYLFTYDLKSDVLLNAAFPEREGTNVAGKKDVNGKLYHDEFIKVVHSKEGRVGGTTCSPNRDRPNRRKNGAT